MININYSGKEGIEMKYGQSEYNYGIRGGNGKQGEDGMDAKSINLVLKTNEQYQILISEENLKNDYKLTLGLSQNQINLFSDGGNGGKGGEGGRGNQGMDGIDATRYSCGTSGCNGGDGGNRGNGGNGGNGAAITVTADSQDMDLFMLIEQVSYKGGKLGQGGQGGQGGPGGLGGRGGISYSWSEECNGQTRYYTNPGGINGFSGKSGKAGQNGLDGKPGRDGSFNYILEGKQYIGVAKMKLAIFNREIQYIIDSSIYIHTKKQEKSEQIIKNAIKALHEIWDSISDEIVSNTIDQINFNLREVSANNGEIFIEF
ncbi:hypothetical protein ABPG72_022535 [Tetrahymena utriculariae]